MQILQNNSSSDSLTWISEAWAALQLSSTEGWVLQKRSASCFFRTSVLQLLLVSWWREDDVRTISLKKWKNWSALWWSGTLEAMTDPHYRGCSSPSSLTHTALPLQRWKCLWQQKEKRPSARRGTTIFSEAEQSCLRGWWPTNNTDQAGNHSLTDPFRNGSKLVFHHDQQSKVKRKFLA